jgi:uncharacterized membrane protein YhaH (DUF805 family)
VTNPYSPPQTMVNDVAQDGETYQPRVFQWNGRIGRLRYLAYSIGLTLLLMPVYMGLLALGSASLAFVAAVLIFLGGGAISITLGKRRLNDMGYKGWQSVGLLIPLVNLAVGLWLTFGAGDPHTNRYGPPACANSRGVIILAWMLPVVMIVGIIAAISLPAYQGYTNKALSRNSSL